MELLKKKDILISNTQPNHTGNRSFHSIFVRNLNHHYCMHALIAFILVLVAAVAEEKAFPSMEKG